MFIFFTEAHLFFCQIIIIDFSLKINISINLTVAN